MLLKLLRQCFLYITPARILRHRGENLDDARKQHATDASSPLTHVCVAFLYGCKSLASTEEGGGETRK